MPQYGDDGVVNWAKKWKADAIIAQLEKLVISTKQVANFCL